MLNREGTSISKRRNIWAANLDGTSISKCKNVMKNGEIFFLGCFNNCYDSKTKLCLSLVIKGFLTKIDAISHVPSLVSQRNARVITSKIANKEMCY